MDVLNTFDNQDRILNSVLSPLEQQIAIGSAGVDSYGDYKACPLRIYDIESNKISQILMPSTDNMFKRGAGILALSYIDENTLLAAGYDTFMRIFDLRNGSCVQTFEEPEDSTIYCACCSRENGILSGNDRYSIIRYWDKRKNKIINTYQASKYNSPIYSLVCSPEAMFAGHEMGITSFNFKIY